MANVRLTQEVEARLEALGRARDRAPHYLMRKAIERFLEIEEAREAERRLVLDRWEKFTITGDATDHDDIVAWADSRDGKRLG